MGVISDPARDIETSAIMVIIMMSDDSDEIYVHWAEKMSWNWILILWIELNNSKRNKNVQTKVHALQVQVIHKINPVVGFIFASCKLSY